MSRIGGGCHECGADLDTVTHRLGCRFGEPLIAVHEDGHSVPVTVARAKPGTYALTYTPDAAGKWRIVNEGDDRG